MALPVKSVGISAPTPGETIKAKVIAMVIAIAVVDTYSAIDLPPRRPNFEVSLREQIPHTSDTNTNGTTIIFKLLTKICPPIWNKLTAVSLGLTSVIPRLKAVSPNCLNSKPTNRPANKPQNILVVRLMGCFSDIGFSWFSVKVLLSLTANKLKITATCLIDELISVKIEINPDFFEIAG